LAMLSAHLAEAGFSHSALLDISTGSMPAPLTSNVNPGLVVAETSNGVARGAHFPGSTAKASAARMPQFHPSMHSETLMNLPHVQAPDVEDQRYQRLRAGLQNLPAAADDAQTSGELDDFMLGVYSLVLGSAAVLGLARSLYWLSLRLGTGLRDSSASLQLSGAASRTVRRATALQMTEGAETRDADIRYNANEGWQREESVKEGKGKSTNSQDFESSDTPDFFDDSELSRRAAQIDFTDGMMGSQKKPGQSGTHNPGVEGALEVNPDIYVPEEEVIEIENSDFVKPSMTTMDLEMFTIQDEPKGLQVSVKPVAMTYEPFYCGFTADSHPAFSVSPTSGKMERRNGDPTQVTVTCTPNGAKGELKATLCFILPEEKMFSTYYGILCHAR